MSNKINDLKSRVGDLKRQLRDAEDRLHSAQMETASLKIGDIVIHRGIRHRVCGARFFDSGKPWVTANPQKKNGEYAQVIRNLCDGWEHSHD